MSLDLRKSFTVEDPDSFLTCSIRTFDNNTVFPISTYSDNHSTVFSVFYTNCKEFYFTNFCFSVSVNDFFRGDRILHC